MKRFKKTFNPNRIRINRSFSVPEIAELLGVNRFTILYWHRKEGLSAIDGRIPYMFHGKELRRFIRERQKRENRNVPPMNFFALNAENRERV